MTETAKTCPGTAIPGQTVENGRVCETVQPFTKNDTTSPAERQPPRIADLILAGAENAVPRRDLMAWTGLSDRMLRRQIETERRLGTPILSDCIGGYFLPVDLTERDRCVRSLRRRAEEIMETAAAIEQAEV